MDGWAVVAGLALRIHAGKGIAVQNHARGPTRMKGRWISGVTAVILACSMPVRAQDAQQKDLAKAAQNPVADLISLPFQNNTNFGLGPDDRVQNVLNVQPVVPFNLSENWNLITRTILPVIRQPSLMEDEDRTWGLGDTSVSFFFSPSDPGKLVWGVGPVLVVPSATAGLGADEWGGGFGAVALTMPGNWVFGGLINRTWSFSEVDGGRSVFPSRPEVDQILLQYFINYNLPRGWYLTSAPIITGDYNRPGDDRWTVPFGGGAGRLLTIGKRPINVSMQAYANVEKPRFGPDWTLRLQLQLLFPK